MATELVVSKTSLSNDAAIGDFVRYQVAVENTEALASSIGVVVTDVLPIGFRYQSGSARLNGVLVADPVITADGRTLEFAIGDIAAGTIVNLTYVTEVTSGTPLGNAINSASAIDTL